MATLREQALLAAVQDKTTLKELIDFCSSSTEIKDVCYFSKNFWLSVLPKVGQLKIALAFEPLKDQYWEQLINGLLEGIFYRKVFELEDFLNPLEPETPILLALHSPLKIEEIMNRDEVNQTSYLDIPGIKLPSGTKGWTVEFSFDQDVKLIKNYFLLASPGGNDKARLLEFITHLYLEKLKAYNKYSDSWRSYVLSTEDMPLNIYELPEPDNVRFFKFQNQTMPLKITVKTLLEGNFEVMPDNPNWLNARIQMLEEKEDSVLVIESTFNVYKSWID